MSEQAPDWMLDEEEPETAADTLERVRELAELLVRQEDSLKHQTDLLTHAKAAYNQTRLHDLPELLKEVGLPGLRLTDGTAIDLKQDVDASITKAKKPAALKWLEEHGFGGLIKTKVMVEFAKDKREDALECVQSLSEDYSTVRLDDSVHPGTFKSFVKEQMEKGLVLPEELFSIHPYDVATVTRGKNDR